MHKEPDRNPRKALGKGLSALLPGRGPTSVLEQGPTAKATPTRTALPEHFEEFHNIPLEQISASEEQPRESFDGDKMQELSQSIRANGLIQPITVYRSGPDRYTIIAGERRWRAASLAGLKEIPALVRNVEKAQLLQLALIENIQREDLNPIEIAIGFQRLATEYELSHEEIARRTGKERSTVTNFIRLLKLSPRLRNEVVRGTLTLGHARALLNIADEGEQWAACEQILQKGLSVRETERLVKHLTNAAKPRKEREEGQDGMDPNVRAALDEIAMALGTKVRLVARSEKAGRLEIEYYSQDDLDRIYSVIVRP
ncbi:MAG TPA: ParB/RepB/Spo0J family partition protein [Bryobacteraceae bacterium]|jgi:ParB family chromosome partitioning protein|nr:ParB/RepB/Spo0J family partition protein [Bryobacteraceae bacterium]